MLDLVLTRGQKVPATVVRNKFMNIANIDFNTPGWVKLTPWQRLRLAYARYTAGSINVYATDGYAIEACPDFAELNWKCPGLYQELIDKQADREKFHSSLT